MINLKNLELACWVREGYKNSKSRKCPNFTHPSSLYSTLVGKDKYWEGSFVVAKWISSWYLEFNFPNFGHFWPKIANFMNGKKFRYMRPFYTKYVLIDAVGIILIHTWFIFLKSGTFTISYNLLLSKCTHHWLWLAFT